MNLNSIRTKTITKGELALPEYEVVGHPQGGFALARRVPGSTVLTYDITHQSEEYLLQVLDEKRKAAIRAAFAGKLAEGKAHEPEQMSLGISLPRRGFDHAA